MRGENTVREDELQRMYELEDTYWWFVGRKAIISRLLRFLLPSRHRRRILDVGCGSGATMLVLRQFGWVVGLDPSPAALSLSRSRGHTTLLQGDALRLPVRDESFDLVTALDVVEHLPDDLGVLREFYRVLTPEEGMLLLTVPAYQFLWSEHDEALNHLRRYTAGELRKRVTAAGFTIRRLSYAITFLLPLAVIFRLAQRLVKRQRRPRTALIELPAPLNSLFTGTLFLEAFLLPWLDFPGGVSVVCVAEKRCVQLA